MVGRVQHQGSMGIGSTVGREQNEGTGVACMEGEERFIEGGSTHLPLAWTRKGATGEPCKGRVSCVFAHHQHQGAH